MLRTIMSAMAIGLLAGCTTAPSSPPNLSLNSLHQPIVDQGVYAIDLMLTGDNLSDGEASRLARWLDGISAGKGDRYVLDADVPPAARAGIASVADANHVALADPVTATLPVPMPIATPGVARLTVMRNRAFVRGCPDWSANNGSSNANATSPNYGCASNSNLAAMIADPAHLVHGVAAERTTTAQIVKAIKAKESAPPRVLSDTSSSNGQGGNNP